MDERTCIINAELSCEIFPRCVGCNAYRVPTNADHIRAMSDEEMKDFLCSILQCEFCKFEGWGGCECLEWLKAPYKEKEE